MNNNESENIIRPSAPKPITPKPITPPGGQSIVKPMAPKPLNVEVNVPLKEKQDVNTIYDVTTLDNNQNKSLTEKLWFGWIMFFLFWPFAIYVFNKGGHKKSLYFTVGIIVLGILCGIFGK